MGDWRKRAACRDTDPELFFPAGTTGVSLLQIEEAKQVCRRCPSMSVQACLRAAVEMGAEGVWGGMTLDERKSLKRREQRAARRPNVETSAEGDKECPGCEETKPVSDFHKDRLQSDGLNRTCKECQNQASREQRARRREAA